ncbi:hypothetical protein N9A94_00550 [Akkermansiaceae bacterium]|nr:hypothetical protein [Akkermansiaceae bacterium]
MTNRRRFLAGSAATIAGVTAVRAQKSKESKASPIIVFEKPIQTLDYDRMGEILAKMGIQGIEATIRKGGHIDPGKVEEGVPKMVADLAKNGQKALIAATNIREANAGNEKFLRILKANGITRYRSDYYRYDLKKEMLPQVKENAAKLKDLAAMNKEIGVQSLYQIHSGYQYAGAMSWDAALMFDGIDPDHAAIAYDLRHFRTDSGLSWRTALATVKKHIRSIYVKDAVWGGERSNKLKNVPLDTGFVDKETFKAVRKGLGPMPLSLHMEWGKSQLYPKDEVMEAVEFVARDVKTLKSWL